MKVSFPFGKSKCQQRKTNWTIIVVLRLRFFHSTGRSFFVYSLQRFEFHETWKTLSVEVLKMQNLLNRTDDALGRGKKVEKSINKLQKRVRSLMGFYWVFEIFIAVKLELLVVFVDAPHLKDVKKFIKLFQKTSTSVVQKRKVLWSRRHHHSLKESAMLSTIIGLSSSSLFFLNYHRNFLYFHGKSFKKHMLVVKVS